MPKVVDHDQRRAEVIEATCAVIADHGLEATTMRRIADRAGCTTGLVTHYYTSKHEILVAALRHVHRAAGARMLDALAASSGPEALHSVIEQSLPLDERRLREWKVWLAFWGKASTSKSLRAEQRARYSEWTELLHQLFAASDISAPVDGIVALIDGIGTRATVDPASLPPARQLELIHGYLAD